MKMYVPIGYYYDTKDILDLFPSGAFKGDEADIIVKYFLDGYGAFSYFDHPDVDSYISPGDASAANDIVFTSDGEYIVVFTPGNYHLLHNMEDGHGFFIDIYRLEEVSDDSVAEPRTEKELVKLQATYDKLIAVREKIDKILADIAPYVAK